MPCSCDRHDRRHGQCDPSCACWNQELARRGLHEHQWAFGPVVEWVVDNPEHNPNNYGYQTANRVLVMCVTRGCERVREVTKGTDLVWRIQQ